MGYYIVDTNIIISYMDNDKPQLTSFINKPENKFFYTNTVRKELSNERIPDVFKFVDSNVHSSTIDLVLDDIQVSIGLRLKKFRNDVSIIFEAGFICYDITPYKGALLLTNNLKLYKKSSKSR